MVLYVVLWHHVYNSLVINDDDDDDDDDDSFFVFPFQCKPMSVGSVAIWGFVRLLECRVKVS